MDVSKFKPSDWLKVGGGALTLIGGFLAFYSQPEITVGGVVVSSGDGSVNAFEFFWTGTLVWLLVVAVGVLSFLLAGGMLKKGTTPWTLLFLAATAVAALFIICRVLFSPGVPSEAADRGIGMWFLLLGTLAALAGSFMGFTEAGGSLNDLTDVNKIKAQFGQKGGGHGAPPPPPPPGGGSWGSPPPPPPPGR